MSRVDAVKVAVMKAGGWRLTPGARPLAGTVAASDAFFPFRDGLDAVAAAGATAVVQPGGSVRTPRSLPLPTSKAWRWCSPAAGTSDTD